jgi:hypothetical protein
MSFSKKSKSDSQTEQKSVVASRRSACIAAMYEVIDSWPRDLVLLTVDYVTFAPTLRPDWFKQEPVFRQESVAYYSSSFTRDAIFDARNNFLIRPGQPPLTIRRPTGSANQVAISEQFGRLALAGHWGGVDVFSLETGCMIDNLLGKMVHNVSRFPYRFFFDKSVRAINFVNLFSGKRLVSKASNASDCLSVQCSDTHCLYFRIPPRSGDDGLRLESFLDGSVRYLRLPRSDTLVGCIELLADYAIVSSCRAACSVFSVFSVFSGQVLWDKTDDDVFLTVTFQDPAVFVSSQDGHTTLQMCDVASGEVFSTLCLRPVDCDPADSFFVVKNFIVWLHDKQATYYHYTDLDFVQ